MVHRNIIRLKRFWPNGQLLNPFVLSFSQAFYLVYPGHDYCHGGKKEYTHSPRPVVSLMDLRRRQRWQPRLLRDPGYIISEKNHEITLAIRT